jgi:hypothetical protein
MEWITKRFIEVPVGLVLKFGDSKNLISAIR